MSSQICRSASRAARSLLSSAKNARFFSEIFCEGLQIRPSHVCSNSVLAAEVIVAKPNTYRYILLLRLSLLSLSHWISLFQSDGTHFHRYQTRWGAARTGLLLISEIILRFERKGYKLVGIKVMVPSKGFAQKHYHDLKERPFFNGFLISVPVVAMVWEGEGVIRYGRKLIGATDPQKSLCCCWEYVLVCFLIDYRNIIHGSDGPETAKDEISLWFKPEELVSFTGNAEKWIYGQN
ncbi:hypothetical protein ARALYDRAFT_492474 [Arabidopsis lyrata subsp. lyrata]|uniref:Nucleoside diphosphate kinase n=1 Tax=Arabidopsis lyrata subsp. lyrata TaxID=81972 RepID=D7M900_ARALL|nr:hypothetical protein ARALYDRAFT_492474 [Arabidopsis lyrata subsp. lyrata]